MTRSYEFRPEAAFFNYVCVRISETRKEMHADTARYFAKYGKRLEHDAGTAGMSTPTAVKMFTGEGKAAWYCDRFVTVFLNHQDARKNPHEIVPHEALHAAMTHERSVQHFDMRYSPDGSTIEDEERLAHKVGQIAVGIHSALAQDRRARAAKKKR
jgi:hypothetical protein